MHCVVLFGTGIREKISMKHINMEIDESRIYTADYIIDCLDAKLPKCNNRNCGYLRVIVLTKFMLNYLGVKGMVSAIKF